MLNSRNFAIGVAVLLVGLWYMIDGRYEYRSNGSFGYSQRTDRLTGVTQICSKHGCSN